MLIVGLTGSIGMGKSTTATMFRDRGIPVHDADAAVHDLYKGRAAPLVEAAFPGTTTDGAVDRVKLRQAVLGNDDAMVRLEAIVHPLVREEETAFIARAKRNGASFAILDIPLLFETGGDKRVDRVVVVTAPAQVQRDRVLARDGMTEDAFNDILARQMPDAEKRERADFLVDTSRGLDDARRQVAEICDRLEADSNMTTGSRHGPRNHL